MGRFRARPARPGDVARAKGMMTHLRPLRRPLWVLAGLAAIADCQQDWSPKTVPKLPRIDDVDFGPPPETIVR